LHGYGVRVAHYGDLREQGSRVGFVEAITENVIGRGGRARAVLERVRCDAELALHGVSMSLGGCDALDAGYLAERARLIAELEPCVVSDHLCFASVDGKHGHDLWPLPHTEEAVAHVAARIQRVQETLGRRIAIENVSSYVRHRADTMTEWEFVGAVAERADCHILLDLNTVVVNAKNHAFEADAFIDAMPASRVVQLHLAGHSDHGSYAIDDHGSSVPDAVWRLHVAAVSRWGPVPSIVEWDRSLPALDVLREQSALAARNERRALASARGGAITPEAP
jgi:uncharacterized protein (UPF0276 family)